MTTQGIEEEEAVLGAILVRGECYQEVASILEERYFYKEEHRLIWRAMSRLYEAGSKIDAISVSSKLREKRCLTLAGGTVGVSGLTDALFDVANVVYYAKQVKKASDGREIKGIGRRLMMDDVDPYERLDIGLAGLSEVNRRAVRTKEVPVGEISKGIIADIVSGNGATEGLRMGFYELDEPLGGLKQQDFIVLAARPSIGKSAFTLQVAANVAREGNQVLYISPEMSRRQLTLRLLSMESRVPYSKIIKPNRMTPEEIVTVQEAERRIRTLPIEIDDASDQSITSVKLAARRMESGKGLSLLIVDYLQLLCEGDDSKEAVTKISKGLKAIAKDLYIPVWAVSQLSRSVIYRTDPRPTLSDLRGSGQIEQDADIVMLLYHPAKKTHPDKIEVFIEKHRNGPLGQCTFKFNKETTTFGVGVW